MYFTPVYVTMLTEKKNKKKVLHTTLHSGSCHLQARRGHALKVTVQYCIEQVNTMDFRQGRYK